MTSRFRSLRRLRHSPLFIAALVLFLTSGAVVGGTFASFTAETQQNTSTYATGWLSAPTGLTFTPSGYDAQLTWTAGTHGLDGQSLYNQDNGSSSSCPTSGYSSTAMASSSTSSYTQSNSNGYTTASAAITAAATSITVASAAGFPGSGNYTIQIDDEQMTVTAGQGTTTWTVTRGVNSTTAAAHLSGAGVVELPDPYNGHYICDQMVSTLSGSSWNASASFPATQIGLVLQSVLVTNNGTANLVGTNDTVVATFNQKPTVATITNTAVACESWDNAGHVTLWLYDAAFGGAGHPVCGATNQTYDLRLTGLTKAVSTAGTSSPKATITVSSSSPWTVTWKLTSNSTATLTGQTGVTATPSTNVPTNASTDKAPACVSATYNCLPTMSGTF